MELKLCLRHTPILRKSFPDYEESKNQGIFHFKLNTTSMKKTSPLHISEGVRNAIIVIAIFGTIAVITYLEWSGRLH